MTFMIMIIAIVSWMYAQKQLLVKQIGAKYYILWRKHEIWYGNNADGDEQNLIWGSTSTAYIKVCQEKITPWGQYFVKLSNFKVPPGQINHINNRKSPQNCVKSHSQDAICGNNL